MHDILWYFDFFFGFLVIIIIEALDLQVYVATACTGLGAVLFPDLEYSE